MSPSFRTPVCERLGIELPVVLAGMGGVSWPKLVAAVSNAGGLGVYGAAGLEPEQIREHIREIKSSPTSRGRWICWCRCRACSTRRST